MKKLENEYRQLMQNEVPDLWSRIEAGVDAKIAEGGKSKSENIDDVDDAWAVETKENEKRKVINWKKYSLPLVACIAAILCVPMLLTGFFRMAYGGKSATTEMAADYAAADCAEPEETMSVTTDNCTAVVTDEACDEEIDDAYEYVTEDSVADDSVAMAESQLMEEPESILDRETTSGTVDDYKQNKQEVSESIQILTIIQITQEQSEADSGSEKGMVYYLNTEEVGECTLYVPADAEFVSDMDVQLKIQVEPSDYEYDFVFVGIVE